MELRLTKKRLIAAGVIGALLIAWLGYVLFWTTDRDRIKLLLKDLAKAADAANTDAVMAAIGEDFEAQDMTRSHLRTVVAGHFEMFGPTTVKYSDWGALNISGNRAITDVTVYASTSSSKSPYPIHGQSKWRLTFKRYGDRWLIRAIEPLEFESRAVEGWQGIPSFSSWKP